MRTFALKYVLTKGFSQIFFCGIEEVPPLFLVVKTFEYQKGMLNIINTLSAYIEIIVLLLSFSIGNYI